MRDWLPFCYARPSHAYLGLSPGIDWETRLTAKSNAAEVLRGELAKPGYRCETIVIGVNTDAYQPIEREHRITRSVLEVAVETRHPVGLITKSALIERDIDLIQDLARDRLVSVTLTIVTLDHGISRYLEPRASAPARRLLAMRRLEDAGIPVHVNVAPVIPFLTDSELEAILEAATEAGATTASYTLLRLPWEVKDIFRAWLEERFPLKAAHVMSRVHDMRGGRDNDPNFGTRMKGQGLWSELLRQRFDKACARLGLNKDSCPPLSSAGAPWPAHAFLVAGDLGAAVLHRSETRAVFSGCHAGVAPEELAEEAEVRVADPLAYLLHRQRVLLEQVARGGDPKHL